MPAASVGTCPIPAIFTLLLGKKPVSFPGLRLLSFIASSAFTLAVSFAFSPATLALMAFSTSSFSSGFPSSRSTIWKIRDLLPSLTGREMSPLFMPLSHSLIFSLENFAIRSLSFNVPRSTTSIPFDFPYAVMSFDFNSSIYAWSSLTPLFSSMSTYLR
ncbi:MAG: hypothetical protein A4E57_03771 [Syntrophorhabdaceae bacterium PtaU1.Bin034]|nr:MAG: hypothetical protein A4E57_03771 [Syntrophorhabdaceae bacterium PtaU1.Bin034]